MLIAGYEGMGTGNPVAPNVAARMTRDQVGEALLALYAASGNTAKRAEWEARLRK